MRFSEAERLAGRLAGLVFSLWLVPASAAGSQALVIGNGGYSFLPALAACPASAKAVATALRAAAFTVTEKEDLPSGAMQAALSAFSQANAGAPQAPVLVYICGYVSEFNDRDFLLPISAAVSRASDVLAQGVLAKSALDTLWHGIQGAGVIVLDAVPTPMSGAQPLGLKNLSALPLPDEVGMVAATDAAADIGPTPLASALVASLTGPTLTVGDLLGRLQAAVRPTPGAQLLVLRPPARPAHLIGEPEPPPAPARAPELPPLPAAPPSAPSAVATADLPAAPDEAHMTESDRRHVQVALAQLGYYDGRIDGVFGSDTRAAIRRYQHEVKAEMTGMLTQAETARLFAALR